jgi:hypothetical protein
VTIDREESRHAASGLGIHRCRGPNLAPGDNVELIRYRIEILVAL